MGMNGMEAARGRRAVSKRQIAEDLEISTRQVDRLNIPGKTYAFGRHPRWWWDIYEDWKRSKQEVAA
jgi:hypothetical protein